LIYFANIKKTLDNSVGITTGYWWKVGVRLTVKACNISISHFVHTGSGVHSASSLMGAGVSFIWGKDAGDMKLIINRHKKWWSYISLPHKSL
jgi:hypothetical protein